MAKVDVSLSDWNDLVREGSLISLKQLIALAAGLDPWCEIQPDTQVDLSVAGTFKDAWNYAIELIEKGRLRKIDLTFQRLPFFDPIIAFTELKIAGFKLCERVENLLAQVDRFDIPVPISKKSLRGVAKSNGRYADEKALFVSAAKKLWAKQPSLTIVEVARELYSNTLNRQLKNGKGFKLRTIQDFVREHCPNPRRGNPNFRKK